MHDLNQPEITSGRANASLLAQAWVYWGGRRLWLWLLLATGCEAWLVFAPEVGLSSPAFQTACAVSCWIPAWVCADLLSVRKPDNPAPHREWRPRAFLLIAVGRLVPLLAVLTVWCGTYVARSLLDELHSSPAPFFQAIQEWRDFPAVWLAWTLVFVVSALTYAAASALCSSLFRRPRRWLVTSAIVVPASVIVAGVAELMFLPYLDRGGWAGSSLANPPFAATLALLTPNYLVGSTLAAGTLGWLEKHGVELDWFARIVPPGIAIFCWIATLFFLCGTLALVLATGWVARQRYLRHPYTATTPADSDEPVPDTAPRPVEG